MKLMMCLTVLVMIGVVVLFTDTRPASGCTDWDEDGVCAENDCNDFNPTVGYDGDADGDGSTVCQGDCADDDPSILRCGEVFRMYPVFYNPPEQPCSEGYTITTKLFNCWPQPDGTLCCEATPFYEYDTNYLRGC